MSWCNIDTYVYPCLKKKLPITATEVILIYVFSLTVCSKPKIKMKRRNTMALSYQSKGTSKNKGFPFSSCFVHGVYYLSSCLG